MKFQEDSVRLRDCHEEGSGQFSPNVCQVFFTEQTKKEESYIEVPSVEAPCTSPLC